MKTFLKRFYVVSAMALFVAANVSPSEAVLKDVEAITQKVKSGLVLSTEEYATLKSASKAADASSNEAKADLQKHKSSAKSSSTSDDADFISDEISKSSTQLDKLKKLKDKAADQVKSKKSRFQEHEQNEDERSDKLKKLKKELSKESDKKEIAKLEDKIRDLEKSKSNAKDLKEKAERELNDAKKELKDLSADTETLEGKISKLKKNLTAAQKKSEDATSHSQDLKAIYDAESKRAQDLKKLTEKAKDLIKKSERKESAMLSKFKDIDDEESAASEDDPSEDQMLKSFVIIPKAAKVDPKNLDDSVIMEKIGDDDELNLPKSKPATKALEDSVIIKKLDDEGNPIDMPLAQEPAPKPSKTTKAPSKGTTEPKKVEKVETEPSASSTSTASTSSVPPAPKMPPKESTQPKPNGIKPALPKAQSSADPEAQKPAPSGKKMDLMEALRAKQKEKGILQEEPKKAPTPGKVIIPTFKKEEVKEDEPKPAVNAESVIEEEPKPSAPPVAPPPPPALPKGKLPSKKLPIAVQTDAAKPALKSAAPQSKQSGQPTDLVAALQAKQIEKGIAAQPKPQPAAPASASAPNPATKEETKVEQQTQQKPEAGEGKVEKPSHYEDLAKALAKKKQLTYDDDDNGSEANLSDSFFGSSPHIDVTPKQIGQNPQERIDIERDKKLAQLNERVEMSNKAEEDTLKIIKTRLAPLYNRDFSSLSRVEDLIEQGIIKNGKLILSESLTWADITTGWESFRKYQQSLSLSSFEQSKAYNSAKPIGMKFCTNQKADPVKDCLMTWGKTVESKVPEVNSGTLDQQIKALQTILTKEMQKAKSLIADYTDLKKQALSLQSRILLLNGMSKTLEEGGQLSEDELKSLGFSAGVAGNILEDILKGAKGFKK